MFSPSNLLIFSCRRNGNGPGSVSFGTLNYGTHFMKLSTIKAFPESNANVVVKPSNTRVFTQMVLFLLPHWAAIKRAVARLKFPAMLIHPPTTYPIYSKNKAIANAIREIPLPKTTSKMQFSIFSSLGIFHSIKQTVHSSKRWSVWLESKEDQSQ